MTRLFRVPSPRPPAAGRLVFALAVSALAHWALLAMPLVERLRPGAGPSAIETPLTARLAEPPVAAPDAAAITTAEAPVPRPAAGNSGPEGSDTHSTLVVAADADAPLALRVHDPIYYPVNDLDVYPRLWRPLDLDRLSGSGSIRLRLLIDEHGFVNDIAPAESAAGRPDAELLAALAAARFIPARKNGRDVKSRVLLSVRAGPGSGDR